MDENITQPTVEANPVGADTLPLNEGDGATNPQVEPEKKIEERTYTQKELDNLMAKTRGATEREMQKKIANQLGMSSYDENMLYAMREAYENSLTDEEIRNQEFDDLNDENLNLMVELDEKDYMIQALMALSGKQPDDVMKIVKMAQGLKTEDNSVADCIKEVMGIINPQPIVNNTTVTNNMPYGKPLNQPSSSVAINASLNPFRAGSINLTEQGRLWKENPELARKLAGEAGIKLNF